jgi:hypothetical protein
MHIFAKDRWSQRNVKKTNYYLGSEYYLYVIKNKSYSKGSLENRMLILYPGPLLMGGSRT